MITILDLQLTISDISEFETVREFRPKAGMPAGHATVISSTINCSVPVPTQQSYCGKSS